MPNTITHTPDVITRPGRYPHLLVCSCGWTNGWGYVADHAARAMAEAHAADHTNGK